MDIGNNIHLIDGKKYKLKTDSGSLTSWKCPHCGYGKLAYNIQTTEEEHFAKCKVLKKKLK